MINQTDLVKLMQCQMMVLTEIRKDISTIKWFIIGVFWGGIGGYLTYKILSNI